MTPPLHTAILSWVEIFINPGNDEKESGVGNPQVSYKMVRTINSYFCQHPKTYLRRAVEDLGTFFFKMQIMIIELVHMFPYHIKSKSVITTM